MSGDIDVLIIPLTVVTRAMAGATMAIEIMVVVAAPASLTLTTGWYGSIIRTTFATIRLRTATIYIDIADKSTVAPRQRTVEIVGTDVDFPLAIVEEIAQSDVAVAPTPRVKLTPRR